MPSTLMVKPYDLRDPMDCTDTPVDDAAAVAAVVLVARENAFLVEHGISCLGAPGDFTERIAQPEPLPIFMASRSLPYGLVGFGITVAW